MFVEAQFNCFIHFTKEKPYFFLEMPVIEDITEEEEVSRTENLEDRPPEGAKSENKFPIEDEPEVESDSEDFFDASDLTTLQQWQFISVRPRQIRFRKSQFNPCVINWS